MTHHLRFPSAFAANNERAFIKPHFCHSATTSGASSTKTDPPTSKCPSRRRPKNKKKEEKDEKKKKTKKKNHLHPALLTGLIGAACRCPAEGRALRLRSWPRQRRDSGHGAGQVVAHHAGHEGHHGQAPILQLLKIWLRNTAKLGISAHLQNEF